MFPLRPADPLEMNWVEAGRVPFNFQGNLYTWQGPISVSIAPTNMTAATTRAVREWAVAQILRLFTFAHDSIFRTVYADP